MPHPFGQYHLLEDRSQEGDGEIWLARGPDGSELELRMLPVHAGASNLIARARALAAVRHPNLEQIVEAGEVEGRPFVATKPHAGVGLKQLFARLEARGERMPATIAARIVADAAAGLACLEGARDPAGRPLHVPPPEVSPARVRVGFDGKVKLVGLADLPEAVAAPPPGALGRRFAALTPEGTRSDAPDPRSTVFRLGELLVEALAGSDRSPLGADERLRAIADRAVDPDRASRYASARELSQALRDWLLSAAEPVDEAQLAGWLEALSAPAAGLAWDRDQPDWSPSGPALSPNGSLDSPPAPPAPLPTPVSEPPREEPLELDEEKLAHAEARAFTADNAEVKRYREEPPPRRKRFWPVVLVLFVLFATGGLVATLLTEERPVRLEALGVETLKELPRSFGETGRDLPLVVIDSEPSGAEVWRGSELLGTTPWAGQNELSAGSQRLRLVKPGYRAATVEIPAGREWKQTVSLKRQ